MEDSDITRIKSLFEFLEGFSFAVVATTHPRYGSCCSVKYEGGKGNYVEVWKERADYYVTFGGPSGESSELARLIEAFHGDHALSAKAMKENLPLVKKWLGG